MNKNSYVSVFAILFVIAVLAVMYIYGNPSPANPDMGNNPPQGKMVTGSDLETFSGTITAVNTGCFADGICSVTVDDKEVILLTGWGGMAEGVVMGKLIGVESIGDLEGKIGSHANVYAGLTPEGKHTLYGNANYYVEVVTLNNN